MAPSPSKLSLTSWYVPLGRILSIGAGFDTVQVDITEDQTSPDQLREAFQGAANNKVRLKDTSFLPLARLLNRMCCALVAVCDGAGFAFSTHTRRCG